VRSELERYGAGLEERPFIVILSKIDLLPDAALAGTVDEWRARLRAERNLEHEDGEPLVIGVSSVSGAGIERLKAAVFAHAEVEPVEPAPIPEARELIAEHAVYRPVDQSGYEVERASDRSFAVTGPAIERLIARHDLENPDALAYIEERLAAMGVIKQLEAKGFEPGAEVTIGDVAFDLYPGMAQKG
jgi:GTP-binding protein